VVTGFSPSLPARSAQLSIVGAEISGVRARKLWPRSLVKGEFTEADLRAFEDLAASTLQDEKLRGHRAATLVPGLAALP